MRFVVFMAAWQKNLAETGNFLLSFQVSLLCKMPVEVYFEMVC